MDTPYVFHCEEDFPLLPKFCLRASRKILQNNPQVFTVILWKADIYGTDSVPLADGTRLTRSMNWPKTYPYSFTFNPGLRRMSDYAKHGPYSRLATFNREKANSSECVLAKHYQKQGFRLAHAFSYPTVAHIGDGRHVDQNHPTRRSAGDSSLAIRKSANGQVWDRPLLAALVFGLLGLYLILRKK